MPGEPEAPTPDPALRHQQGRRQRRLALGVLVVMWLAFAAPAFLGKVRFPVDYAKAFPGPPASRVVPHGQAASNLNDADTFYALYPFHVELGQRLAQGQLPLWDTSRFLGAPYAANIGMGTFYPLNWPYALGHPVRMETIIWLISILACLLMANWFLTVVDLHPFAAALGAIIWTFCGYMIGWGNHDPVIQAAIWLPLALGGLEVARRGRARVGIPIAGVGLALSLLAGQLQTTAYAWLIVAVWAVVSVAAALLAANCTGTSHRTRGSNPSYPSGPPSRSGRGVLAREFVRSAALPAAAFALGAGLAAVQILGVLEFSTQTVRQSVTYAQATAAPQLPPVAAGRLPAGLLTTALIPDFHGNPLDNNYDYHGALPNYTQTTFYAGILVFPLMAAAAFSKRRRLLAFFGLVTLVGSLSAFGTPFYHLIFSLVPGMNRLPALQRFIFLIDAGLAGLAAVGLDTLVRGEDRRAGVAAIATATAVCAGIVALTLTRWGTPVPASYITNRGERAFGLAFAGLALLLALHRFPRAGHALVLALVVLGAADLWVYGIRYHPYADPVPVYTATSEVNYLETTPGQHRYVQADAYVLPPNSSMVSGQSSLNGYDEFIPARFADLLAVMDPGVGGAAETNFIPPITAKDASSPILDLLGVTSVIAPLNAPGLGTPAFSGSFFSVYNRPNAFPPAFETTCWQGMADSAVLGHLATMTGPQLRSTAVVSVTPGQAPLGTSGTSPASCTPGPAATVNSDAGSQVRISTDAPQGGILVLSDQWYPGWTVTVDGHRAPLLLVDYALRGVALGPGPHTVEFDYRPAWPLRGLALTLVALDLCVAGITLDAHRRRPGAPGQALGPLRRLPPGLRQRPGGSGGLLYSPSTPPGRGQGAQKGVTTR